MINFDKAFSYNEGDIKPGTLLLSEPFMEDPNFKRSVIAMCNHTLEEGSLGFVINQPIQIDLHDILEDFPEIDGKVFYGGPVQQDTLHYLHTLGDELEDAKHIVDDIYWGGNFEQLKMILLAEPEKATNFKFFLGYSGWSSGQLAEELRGSSWMVIQGNHDLIWNALDPEDWSTILQKKGGVFKHISNFPSNPQLN